MPYALHGGAYPYASLNTAGDCGTNDYCMSVGVRRKAPLRMAGRRMAMLTTVQAAIPIGRTGHTITSLPT